MDRSYYENYHELEKNHWWHKARIEILKDILNSKLDEFFLSAKVNLAVKTERRR